MRNSVIVNVISVNSSVYEHHAVIIEIISLSVDLLPTCHNSAVLVVVELLSTPAYPAALDITVLAKVVILVINVHRTSQRNTILQKIFLSVNSRPFILQNMIAVKIKLRSVYFSPA